MTNSSINFDFKFNRLWRKAVLSNLKIASNEYYYGYYVSSNDIQSKQIAKYIARYVRHPAIANGRIINYSKENVTFFYKDYNKNKIVIKKPVANFIGSLIQHIPKEQFKMVRYYGAYSWNQGNKHTRHYTLKSRLP